MKIGNGMEYFRFCTILCLTEYFKKAFINNKNMKYKSNTDIIFTHLMYAKHDSQSLFD